MMNQHNKYLATPDNLLETIERYGVGVIERVFDNGDCDRVLSGMWDFLEGATSRLLNPIKRDVPETYQTIFDLYPNHSMLLQYWGVGHAQVLWDVRQDQRIINIFRTIHQTDDLLVSFDGMSFGMPPEIVGKGWRKKLWLHSDQSFSRNSFECIQSLLTPLDVNVGDGTFYFLEGSNNFHEDFALDNLNRATSKSDWGLLNEQEIEQYKAWGCTEQAITCPRGSMIFWDSRTIHCGVEPLEGRPQPNFRTAIYLCYTPRDWATPAQLKKKRRAFDTLRTTNHYPHKIKMFPIKSHTWGRPVYQYFLRSIDKSIHYNEPVPDIAQIDHPDIDEVGLALAGF